MSFYNPRERLRPLHTKFVIYLIKIFLTSDIDICKQNRVGISTNKIIGNKILDNISMRLNNSR